MFFASASVFVTNDCELTILPFAHRGYLCVCAYCVRACLRVCVRACVRVFSLHGIMLCRDPPPWFRFGASVGRRVRSLARWFRRQMFKGIHQHSTNCRSMCAAVQASALHCARTPCLIFSALQHASLWLSQVARSIHNWDHVIGLYAAAHTCQAARTSETCAGIRHPCGANPTPRPCGGWQGGLHSLLSFAFY